MQEIIIETPRLLLRNFRQEDAVGFYALNNDPEVLRYTGDEAFRNVEEAAQFIAHYHHYQQYGYGRWAVVHKQDDAFIGFCGLKYHPEVEATDLGFRLMRDYWGQGLATEAARACVGYSFQSLQLPKLIGRVEQPNLASIRVLEKMGMQRVRSFDFEGKPGYWYELTQEDYKNH
jgi:ribosomal-protein-alanine N-acetyltransferase